MRSDYVSLTDGDIRDVLAQIKRMTHTARASHTNDVFAAGYIQGLEYARAALIDKCLVAAQAERLTNA